MMTHNEIIKVLEAHRDGKNIEFFNEPFTRWVSSIESLETLLGWINKGVKYRIDTEPPKPKYVPFENMEDVIPHCNKWVKPKNGCGLFRFSCIINRGIKLSDGEFYEWALLFEVLEFSDGLRRK